MTKRLSILYLTVFLALSSTCYSQKQYIGQKLPDFKMTNLTGDTISYSNYDGNPLVLNFWFTACLPCVLEIPELNEIKSQKDYSHIKFVAVTFDNRDKVLNFLNKKEFKFDHLINAKEYCEKFTTSYPINVFVDRNGIVTDVLDGMPIIMEEGQDEFTGKEKVNSTEFIKALERIK